MLSLSGKLVAWTKQARETNKAYRLSTRKRCGCQPNRNIAHGESWEGSHISLQPRESPQIQRRERCITSAFHSCCKSCTKKLTAACSETFSYLFIWTFKLKITESFRADPNFLEVWDGELRESNLDPLSVPAKNCEACCIVLKCGKSAFEGPFYKEISLDAISSVERKVCFLGWF